jgi:hypothetical protein
MAVATSISTLESTLPMLEQAGFQKMVFEDFYDVLVSIVQQVVTPDHEGKKMTPEMLLEAFQSIEGMFYRPAACSGVPNLNPVDVAFPSRTFSIEFGRCISAPPYFSSNSG